MTVQSCDILVVGAGPAGLAAAAEAAARGLRTVLLERDPEHPVHRRPPGGITVAAAHGRLAGAGTVAGEAADGSRNLWRAPQVVLAAGDRPHAPADVMPDGRVILTPADPVPDPAPPTVLVAGGGPAGAAAALRWREAGARVVLVTRTPRLLPALDADLAAHLTRRLEMLEVDVRPGVRLAAARREGDGMLAELRGPGGASESLAAACLILAAGRRAATDDLGLDDLPVVRDRRGRLQTDPTGETAVPGLRAAGAVTGAPVSVRTAAAAGRAAAAAAAGAPVPPVAWDRLPRLLPDPLQAAAVGLTAAEAEARGHQVVTGLAVRGELLAKLTADREDGRLLGASLAGPDAARDVEAAAALLAAAAPAAAWARTAPPDTVLARALAALAAEAGRA